ncbi:hypothetical protein NPIL_207011 [Nephila pilipes]|uniref:Uncharacterized protein n=1 Tax=Nephila pilipes TaxID=299642 RepID=A0A8X6N219_NEPPI|nr:hypothetical protein NPIL_207011 [Nephila pilipes]
MGSQVLVGWHFEMAAFMLTPACLERMNLLPYGVSKCPESINTPNSRVPSMGSHIPLTGHAIASSCGRWLTLGCISSDFSVSLIPPQIICCHLVHGDCQTSAISMGSMTVHQTPGGVTWEMFCPRTSVCREVPSIFFGSAPCRLFLSQGSAARKAGFDSETNRQSDTVGACL